MNHLDRIQSIPRYGFLLSPAGNSVQAVKGIGTWIDRFEAIEIVESAQYEIDALRSKLNLIQEARLAAFARYEDAMAASDRIDELSMLAQESAKVKP